MNYKKLKLLEIITNKINPPYKKEITPISKDIISPDIVEKLKPKRANLRGVATKPIKSCNTGLEEFKDENILRVLPKEFLNTVLSITKIDEQCIACGGVDSKVTLIDISDKTNPKELGAFALSREVNSIIKIDEQCIACGGSDSKVTLIDISDKTKPKFISYYTSLEYGVYEVFNTKSISYGTTAKDGWQFDNDKTLYKYARLYDPKADRLVPYFELKKRVKKSDDGKVLTIEISN